MGTRPDARARLEGELVDLLRVRLVEARRAGAVDQDPALGTGSIRRQIDELVDREAAILPRRDRERIAELLERETVGLGRLEILLDDPEVEEVMVNGYAEVMVERRGRIEPSGVSFSSESELLNMIERILAPLGRRVDELSPMVDARLPDGSRVNVVIPPLAVDGPALSIRRFTSVRPDPEELVSNGSVDRIALELLGAAIRKRRSILVSGGTGSGKTTLLNAISTMIDPSERIVTIEDAAELRLQQSHVVRLESRPPSIEGRGAIPIRDLLRNALRMRPDRIVIGEVRGPEALDLLTALNTGHEGAMGTVHANSAVDALQRLEVLTLMAGVGLPSEVILNQLARGIDLIAHTERLASGTRHLASISEVGWREGEVEVRELYRRGAGE